MNANTAAQPVAGTHACACSAFTAVDIIGTAKTTGCIASTKRTFAPGHDARLKGFLIRAGREGLLIQTSEAGDLVDAMQVADLFGFGRMVRDGVARVAKTRKTEAVPTTVKAKVGRWTYEGTVTANGGIFSYMDRKGNHLMADKFTIVG